MQLALGLPFAPSLLGGHLAGRHGCEADLYEEGRTVLDPETVRLLEENLAIIDQAIEESRAALAQDPGSGLLRRILTDTMRRKMDFLRQAAVAIYANT